MLFRLAQQQGISLSALIGLRPATDPMSCNEISWWACFRSICPLSSEMMDINVQALTGRSINWFDPLNDEDFINAEAEELREANKKAREKLKNGH